MQKELIAIESERFKPESGRYHLYLSHAWYDENTGSCLKIDVYFFLPRLC